jgi:hypothetical protein
MRQLKKAISWTTVVALSIAVLVSMLTMTDWLHQGPSELQSLPCS